MKMMCKHPKLGAPNNHELVHQISQLYRDAASATRGPNIPALVYLGPLRRGTAGWYVYNLHQSRTPRLD